MTRLRRQAAAQQSATVVVRGEEPVDAMADSVMTRLRRQASTHQPGGAGIRRSVAPAVIRRVFKFATGFNEFGFLPDAVLEAIEASRTYRSRSRRCLGGNPRGGITRPSRAGVSAKSKR